jgi:isopropylmalate/homocitrate/citramalate synthase
MSDAWAISPFNRAGSEQSPLFARPPRIADCTLRDGEQQASVVFAKEDKVELARRLAEIGIHELEVGTPAVSDDDREAIEQIATAGLGVRLSALARPQQADVDLVKRCGVEGVRISFPISRRQREVKIGLGDDEYVRSALAVSSYAKEQGLEVIFSPYDTTRADEQLLTRLLGAFARERCVDRVRVVDTTGSATPQAIGYLVRLMHERSDGLPLEVHCHNDFGLATANTLAGALAGAEVLSVTVNGIGERAGNAALEEVVMALKVLYGVDVGVATERLTELSHEVSRRSGVRLQPHKAIVGGNAFAHETGMVVAGLLKDPFTAETYSPELVGQQRSIVLGKKSGRASVRFRLQELGLEPDEGLTKRLLARVKEKAIELGRSLSDDEFIAVLTRESAESGESAHGGNSPQIGGRLAK